MAEVAERGPGLDLADPDEHMVHNFFLRLRQLTRMVKERDDIIARQREELAEARRELRHLRRGEGVQVVIEGRSFPLIESTDSGMVVSSLIADDVRNELSQKLAAVHPDNDDWLNSAQRRPDTERIEDSLIAFKEE
jgi:hypothetical protein